MNTDSKNTKNKSNDIYTVLYAGFPGVGKSTLFNNCKHKKILDSDSSKFDKADFPNNYIKHIKDNIGKVDVILISTHEEVRKALVDNNLEFTLVYPNKNLKREYLDRFRMRGNNDNFVKLLNNSWNEWIDELDNQVCKRKIKLKSGQYISDYISICERSELNKLLFNEAKKIMEDNVHETVEHIGWYSVSAFIDYLENNYDIKRKV